MGYVFIEREYGSNLLVIYPTREIAAWAIENCPLVDSLCEEDCLDAYVVDPEDRAETTKLVELCDIVLAG